MAIQRRDADRTEVGKLSLIHILYLYTIPEIHVADLRVRTYLDNTFTKADLEIKVKASAAGKVRITLTHKGEGICQQEHGLTEDSIFTIKTENPKLWSAEEPNLHDLLLEVMNENGEVVEVIPQKVGFRRFELKKMCIRDRYRNPCSRIGS